MAEGALSVGTLTGDIELQDLGSNVADAFARKLESVADQADKYLGEIAGNAVLASATFVAAVGAMGGAILTLGSYGSKLQGIEDAFNHLADAAGQSGKALVDSLQKGSKGLIDDSDAMQASVRLMSSGIKLTEKDFETLGAAARAFGKATGTDAVHGLEEMNQALLTGRTRSLAAMGIVIDHAAAEKKFADSIHATAKELNDAGKLEAVRIATLEKLRGYVDKMGDSELSFGEKIKKAGIAISNWGEDLAKAIANSPHVAAAWDAIGSALSRNFGGAGQTALETIVSWVDRFADAVTKWAPYIIDKIVEIWENVKSFVKTVQDSWSLVPDWFKNIARDATLAGGAVVIAGHALNALGGRDVLGTVAGFATIASGLKDVFSAAASLGPRAAAAMVEWFGSLRTHAQDLATLYNLGGIAGVWKSITVAMLEFAATPLGVTALLTALAASLYKVGEGIYNLYHAWQSGKSMWDFFTAKEDDNFVRRWLGLSAGVDKTTVAIDNQRKSLEELMSPHQAPGLVKGEGLPKGFTSPEDRSKFLLDQTESLKKYNAAWTELNALGEDYRHTLETLTPLQIRTIEYFLKAGASVEQVAAAFPNLKKVEIEAVKSMIKDMEEVKRITDRLIDSINGGLSPALLRLGTGLERLPLMASQTFGNEFTGFALDERGISRAVVGVGLIQDNSRLVAQNMAQWHEHSGWTVQNIYAIADGLSKIGQAAGGMTGTLTTGLAQIVQFYAMWKDPNNPMTGRQAATAAASAGFAVAANLVAQSQFGNTRAGLVTQGALQGASIGTAVMPGWGTAIGAGAGALVGWIAGMREWRKVVDDTVRDFGNVHISEDLAKAIVDVEDQTGLMRAQATLTQLDKIIQEAGGLRADNLEMFMGHLREVFEFLARGTLSAAQAAQILDRNFTTFAAQGTDALGHLSDAMQDIIQRAAEFGLVVPSITQWQQQQTMAAAASVNLITAGMLDESEGGNLTAFDALKKRVDDAQEHLNDLAKHGKGFTREWNDALKELQNSLADQYKAAQIASGGLNDLGIIAVSSYAAMRAADKSNAEALAALHPSLDKIRRAYEDLGLEIDDVALKNLLFEDKLRTAAPAMVDALSGLVGVLVNWDNLHVLTPQRFEAIERSGISMWDRLKAKVLEIGGTEDDALSEMQEFLHEAERDARKLGLPLDENLQKLIDLSKKKGIWTDAAGGVGALNQEVHNLNDTMQRFIDMLSKRLPAAINALPPLPTFPNAPAPAPSPTPGTGEPGGGGGGAGAASVGHSGLAAAAGITSATQYTQPIVGPGRITDINSNLIQFPPSPAGPVVNVPKNVSFNLGGITVVVPPEAMNDPKRIAQLLQQAIIDGEANMEVFLEQLVENYMSTRGSLKTGAAA